MNRIKIIFLFNALFFLTACGLNPNFKVEKFDSPIELLGCQLPFADNYSATATLEDGTCKFSRCLDDTQDNFNNSNINEIYNYLNKNSIDPQNALINNCKGRSACTHALASNKDPIGTIENGTCLFKACLDDNYNEYLANDANEINKYVSSWGEEYLGKSRVESTCKTKKQYCQHPEAFNYTGPDVQKGEPYCIFYACTKKKYEGYEKYLSYLDFLKNYPGEIIEDNNDTRCGAKLVKTNVKELDVNRERLKTPVDVVFIVDDSRSMDDEIDKVRESLINISPTLQNFNSTINLEIHKIDDVNKTVKETVISNSPTSKVTRTEYLRPKPVKTISIDQNVLLSDIQQGISKGMDLVQATYGDGYEKGACYIQRILESFKTSTSKNLITVLLTDEDDNSKGSSKDCYIYSDFDSLKLPNYNWNHVPYKDQSGKDDLINVITEGVIGLNNDKKYGLISIDWNKFTSSCVSKQGRHAESYIRLISQLKNNSKVALEGDICEKDYDKLLDETLTDTIREIIGFKYLIASLAKNPVVDKVEIIKLNNDVVELNPADYRIYDDQKDLYLEINQNLMDLLKQAKKIHVTVTEDK